MAADKSALETSKSQKPSTTNQQGAEPSEYQGEVRSTAGPGRTAVTAKTPENSGGNLNPSAPEDSNITPGSGSEK